MSKLPHLPEVSLSPVYSNPSFGKSSCMMQELTRQNHMSNKKRYVIGRSKNYVKDIDTIAKQQCRSQSVMTPKQAHKRLDKETPFTDEFKMKLEQQTFYVQLAAKKREKQRQEMLRQAVQDMQEERERADQFSPPTTQYSQKLGQGKFQQKEKEMIGDLLSMSTRIQLLQDKQDEISSIRQKINSIRKQNSVSQAKIDQIKKQIDATLAPFYEDEKHIESAIKTVKTAESKLEAQFSQLLQTCNRHAQKLERALKMKNQLFSVASLTRYNSLFSTVHKQEATVKTVLVDAGLFDLALSDQCTPQNLINDSMGSTGNMSREMSISKINSSQDVMQSDYVNSIMPSKSFSLKNPRDMQIYSHSSSDLFQKHKQTAAQSMNLQRFESKLAKLHSQSRFDNAKQVQKALLTSGFRNVEDLKTYLEQPHTGDTVDPFFLLRMRLILEASSPTYFDNYLSGSEHESQSDADEAKVVETCLLNLRALNCSEIFNHRGIWIQTPMTQCLYPKGRTKTMTILQIRRSKIREVLRKMKLAGHLKNFNSLRCFQKIKPLTAESGILQYQDIHNYFTSILQEQIIKSPETRFLFEYYFFLTADKQSREHCDPNYVILDVKTKVQQMLQLNSIPDVHLKIDQRLTQQLQLLADSAMPAMQLFPPSKQFADDVYASIQKLEQKKSILQQFEIEYDNQKLEARKQQKAAVREDTSALLRKRDAILSELKNLQIQDVETDGIYVCLERIPNKNRAELDALKSLAEQKGYLKDDHGVVFMMGGNPVLQSFPHNINFYQNIYQIQRAQLKDFQQLFHRELSFIAIKTKLLDEEAVDKFTVEQLLELIETTCQNITQFVRLHFSSKTIRYAKSQLEHKETIEKLNQMHAKTATQTRQEKTSTHTTSLRAKAQPSRVIDGEMPMPKKLYSKRINLTSKFGQAKVKTKQQQEQEHQQELLNNGKCFTPVCDFYTTDDNSGTRK